MTEEPDTTFGGLLPEHVNVFLQAKPRWVSDGVRCKDFNCEFIKYPSCKFINRDYCKHPDHKYNFCDTHNFNPRKLIFETCCPIAGTPEEE